MDFEVLSAEGEDARRWSELIHALPAERRDIHFLPEYGRIYRDSYGFDPRLAVYSSGDGFVIQPFVRRPLNKLPFLEGAADVPDRWDIANAYGFGGPVASTDDPDRARQLYALFERAFSDWCEVEDIASEFVSLHPFMIEHQRVLLDAVVEPQFQKNIVYVDLARTEAALAQGLRKGHRSSIAAARRAGTSFEREAPTAVNLALFNALYRATMVRKGATERWFVPPNFFESCFRHLGPDRSSLFFVRLHGEIESGCLVMHDFATAYYHFAGTSAEHPALGLNNLMVFEAILSARRAGFKRLHLGGGVSSRSDDSLLRFKAGFSRQRAPLYTYFRIRNKAVYDELSARKRAHEIATLGAESTSDFVPTYRR